MKKWLLLICCLFLVGCKPSISQRVSFEGYDHNCEKIYDVSSFLYVKDGWEIGIDSFRLSTSLLKSQVKEEKKKQKESLERRIKDIEECK